MARNVAIVGMSPSSMDAPLDDPDWEVWSLAWDLKRLPHAKFLFEIHRRQDWAKYRGWTNDGKMSYVEHLQNLTTPCYMQDRYDDVPASIKFPIDEMIGENPTGDRSRDYFGSSIAYMIALAWWERVDKVGIWGVELSQADYHHQRPNLEYWIGRCEERGIPVDVIGPRGFLMQLVAHPSQNGVRYLRYGWIEAPA